MSNPSCETCRFFENDGRDDEYGECRRGPATYVRLDVIEGVGTNYIGVWADVSNSDWCGEYQPKPGHRSADSLTLAQYMRRRTEQEEKIVELIRQGR